MCMGQGRKIPGRYEVGRKQAVGSRRRGGLRTKAGKEFVPGQVVGILLNPAPRKNPPQNSSCTANCAQLVFVRMRFWTGSSLPPTFVLPGCESSRHQTGAVRAELAGPGGQSIGVNLSFKGVSREPAGFAESSYAASGTRKPAVVGRKEVQLLPSVLPLWAAQVSGYLPTPEFQGQLLQGTHRSCNRSLPLPQVSPLFSDHTP